MKKTYICPYCFEKNNINEVEFRCENTAKKMDGSDVCPLEDDAILNQFLGIKNGMPRRKVFGATSNFLQKFQMPAKAICPVCQKESHDRVCKKCHSRLPNDIAETEDMFFSIIGAKNTGKSHYLAVLINIISEVLTKNFPFCISAADDATSQRYKKDFKKVVYDDKVTISATQKRENMKAEDKNPLIYYIKFYKNSSSGAKKPIKTITVAFFDTAGEDLDAEDTMLNVNRYIFNSSGIIFLLDPLQLSGVRERLLSLGVTSEKDLPSINTEMETIISRTIRLIRKANGLKTNEKIKIPLAVAFSKIDALAPILDKSSYLLTNSKHSEYGKFDVGDSENVQMEIESLLSTWSGNDLLQQVSVNFDKYGFFGLSALGCNPGATQKIANVSPLRVEDPFLWLLWQHKLIGSEK